MKKAFIEKKERDRERIEQAIREECKALTVVYRKPETGARGAVQFFIEAMPTPAEGGSYLKFYGTKQRWKGVPLHKHLDLMHVAKFACFFAPYLLLKSSWTIRLYFLTIFAVRKRKFWHFMKKVVQSVSKRTVGNMKIDPRRYGPLETELIRATNKVCDKHETKGKRGHIGLQVRVLRSLVGILAIVLYTDCVYRWRFQDMLGSLDKTRHPAKEIWRIGRIARDREMQNEQLKNKMGWISYIAPALYLDRNMRTLVFDIVREIKPERCALDDEDRYFAYLSAYYKYDGLEPAEMNRRWQEMDRKSGNTFITIAKEAAKEVAEITRQHEEQTKKHEGQI